jgi:predicted Zn-dependent peptidase
MDNIYEMDGYTLHLIKTNKFKNITISLKLQNELNRDTATLRTLLAFVLVGSTKQYPTTKDLAAYLDDMYGARLSMSVASRGKSHVMQLYSGCVNENYLPTKDNLIEKQIELINDLFYHPNVLDDTFDENILELKKKELKERLEVSKDDKFSYSLDKLFDYMGKGEALGIRCSGYEEEIDAITAKELYEYLIKCLNEDSKHLYVVGDVDDSIVELFRKHLKFPTCHNHYESSYQFQSNKNEILEVIETQEVTQAKLNMGYVIDCDYCSDDHYAFSVFNAYFGGFSQSRLFQVVREQNSLCYYVSSSYDAFNGIMIVNCGIEGKDYEKTKQLIQEELVAVQNGNVDEECLTLAKAMLENALRKTNDEAGSMISIDYNRTITDKRETNEEYLNKLLSVTKEDLIRVSLKVKLDTIYLLTMEGKV